MKSFVLAVTALMSLSAFALTELECSGRASGKTISVQVDGGYSPGFRTAYVQTRTSTGEGESKRYSVTPRGGFGNRIDYYGAGFDLEVDFWPDQRPQWGRSYSGRFSLRDMEIPMTTLWCRFPNVRP